MIEPALATVMLGTAAIGALAGLVGSLAVVRRLSLQGDAISHAALPGVGLAFLLGGRSPEALAIGAGIVGWLAMLAAAAIVRGAGLPADVALGGTLAVFFGFGLALLDGIKRAVPDAAQHGLERYLFGQAATMSDDDVRGALIVGCMVALILAIFWKQFHIICFDADYARCLGVPAFWIEVLLTALLVAAVVIGLQAVGVVLMSALIVAPAVTVRPWTNRLGWIVISAAVAGAVAAALGTGLSHALSRPRATVPTGPTIVLCATLMVAASHITASLRRAILRRRAA